MEMKYFKVKKKPNSIYKMLQVKTIQMSQGGVKLWYSQVGIISCDILWCITWCWLSLLLNALLWLSSMILREYETVSTDWRLDSFLLSETWCITGVGDQFN